eukprot:s2497_g9.t1
MLGPSATPEKNVHTADAPGSCFQLSSRDAGDGVVKRGGACTLIIHDDDGDDDDDRDDDGDIDVDVDDAIACCEYDEAEDSYQDDLSDSDGFNLDNDAGAADDDAGDDAADDAQRSEVRELQRRLTQVILDVGPEAFDARGISSLFYAWGIMRFKSKLIKPFCINARKRLNEFDPQSIANMVFGIGLLGLKGEARILDAVGKNVPSRLDEFHPEEVTSMVYSLGRLKYAPAGGLLEAIGDYVIDRLDEFNPVQLTKIAVAACELDFKKNRLMLVLWNDIARKIKLYSIHQILLLVRTAAQMRLKHVKFTKAATAEVMARLKDLGRATASTSAATMGQCTSTSTKSEKYRPLGEVFRAKVLPVHGDVELPGA